MKNGMLRVVRASKFGLALTTRLPLISPEAQTKILAQSEIIHVGAPPKYDSPPPLPAPGPRPLPAAREIRIRLRATLSFRWSKFPTHRPIKKQVLKPEPPVRAVKQHCVKFQLSSCIIIIKMVYEWRFFPKLLTAPQWSPTGQWGPPAARPETPPRPAQPPGGDIPDHRGPN
ncbi:hypothetical protein Zmor_009947 [Zophobas morio]|uniref:Uncharacterized protein n=1 Tax=Zophobas morio TaxID=2755281 RepID=A0AA38MJ42_9CUCU|nr:hypothetical protein Zmor_009947 [Zophobas morio]